MSQRSRVNVQNGRTGADDRHQRTGAAVAALQRPPCPHKQTENRTRRPPPGPPSDSPDAPQVALEVYRACKACGAEIGPQLTPRQAIERRMDEERARHQTALESLQAELDALPKGKPGRPPKPPKAEAAT